MQRSELSFNKNEKERKDQNILLLKTEMNTKIRTFFFNEQKRMQRSERLLEKNGCPTLLLWALFELAT